jgi:hypothetical protein
MFQARARWSLRWRPGRSAWSAWRQASTRSLARSALLVLLLLGGAGLLGGLGASAAMGVSWLAVAWQPTPLPTATPQPTPLSSVPADLPANVRSFLQLALPYAFQAHQALGWQTSVILAQWGLEHGWQAPDAQGYNWGNTEYAPGCYRPARFCYANTPAEGTREYIYTAQLPWYAPVTQAVPQGADATAVALGRSPWDEGHYGGAQHPGSSLLAIMHDFNLYRFD